MKLPVTGASLYYRFQKTEPTGTFPCASNTGKKFPIQ